MDDLMYFNGINGANGDYELPPMTAQVLAKIIAGEELDQGELNELKNRQEDHYEVREGVDPQDLAQAGWGVIFPAKDEQTPAIKEALSELLDHRQKQAGERYREYSKGKGYRPGESKNKFLARHGMGPGAADPDVVPYYLLIVGGPDTIPYRFQSQLDVQYAVGRIHFDTPQEYAQYARSVVDSETGKVTLARQAAFFGVRAPGDRATELSADHMIEPLFAKISAGHPNWETSRSLADEASKAQLGRLLGGDKTPALLFTASHGMGFPNGDPRQLPHQGALLCQDWPGPGKHKGAIPGDFYFSADDVGSDARLLGTMGFFFACYGAGTPKLDAFAQLSRQGRSEIAPHAFIAELPRRLLSHPQGGMLAVIGHVERAWGYSFMWDQAGEQLGTFEDTLKRLMQGAPVGYALEYFNKRYAEISTILTPMIEDKQFDEPVDDLELSGMWTANNDARGYAIIGDPAVRLPVEQKGGKTAKKRSTIKAVTVKAPDSKETQFSPPDEEPQPTMVDPAATSFGLGDQLSGLKDSIQKFANELGNALAEAASDISSLQVRTYTSDDLDSVSQKGTDSAQLRALTRIAFDGDTDVFVPQRAGGVDSAIWKLHLDMVRQARLNRAESLQTLTEMAANLLKSLT